jgi:hypothetical protein
VPVNQTTSTGTSGWAKLGEYAFTQSGSGQKATRTQSTSGGAVADAVRVVRDNTGVTNTRAPQLHLRLRRPRQPNPNRHRRFQASTAITSYAMTYDQVNQITREGKGLRRRGQAHHDVWLRRRFQPHVARARLGVFRLRLGRAEPAGQGDRCVFGE